jgi:hypothetical protein
MLREYSSAAIKRNISQQVSLSVLAMTISYLICSDDGGTPVPSQL